MFFIWADIKQCYISPSLDQKNTFLTHGLCATLSCDLVGDCIPVPGSVWRGMSSRVSPTSWLFPVTVVWVAGFDSDKSSHSQWERVQAMSLASLCADHNLELVAGAQMDYSQLLKIPEAILCGMMGVDPWLAGGHICQDSNGQGCRTCIVIPIHPVCLHFTALSATESKGTWPWSKWSWWHGLTPQNKDNTSVGHRVPWLCLSMDGAVASWTSHLAWMAQQGSCLSIAHWSTSEFFLLHVVSAYYSHFECTWLKSCGCQFCGIILGNNIDDTPR